MAEPAASPFPSPLEIATPPGCEGWEEMYPVHALVGEERREADEGRLWWLNSMHFPKPMPAFDVVAVDAPYYAIGAWQNRVFAIPPAMGIDYRIINGYVYICANPVTDPEKIAERAGHFERRASYYYENWDELYGRWKRKMEALIAAVSELEVPRLGSYEPEEVLGGSGDLSYLRLLDSWGDLLRAQERMWQHHFEFLLLGYGAYLTLWDFCKSALPEIPDQHIAQMVAGIDVLVFRPDRELRRLGELARELGVAAAFGPGRPAEEILAELEGSAAGRQWIEELERVKDPWFNVSTGEGFYHTDRAWLDELDVPFAAIAGHIDALESGRDDGERPTEELERERDRLAEEYGALLDPESRRSFEELLALSRTVFPYVEEHKFFCDYWFQTRFFKKVREFGGLLAEHGFLEQADDVFHLTRHEIAEALEEVALSWATGGPPRGPHYWPPIVARRRELLERLGEWTPPPALGAMPEEMRDPMGAMLWGITTERLQEWASAGEAADERLTGAAASPGSVEGSARVVHGTEELASVRDGEILVCAASSTAWAPSFARVAAVVTDIGGIMSHAAIVCREYGVPAVVGTARATATIRTGDRIRVDGSAGVVTLAADGDGGREP